MRKVDSDPGFADKYAVGVATIYRALAEFDAMQEQPALAARVWRTTFVYLRPDDRHCFG